MNMESSLSLILELHTAGLSDRTVDTGHITSLAHVRFYIVQIAINDIGHLECSTSFSAKVLDNANILLRQIYLEERL